MTSDGKDLLVFHCPGCEKRLKAPAQAAGKNVKCPKCGAPVTIPSHKPAASVFDDPFQLNVPAITDLNQRQQSAAEIKADKEKERESNRRRANRTDHPGALEPVGDSAKPIGQTESQSSKSRSSAPPKREDMGTIPFDSDEEIFAAALPKQNTKPSNSSPAPAGGSTKGSQQTGQPSVFDDDLPELEQLDISGKSNSSIDKILAAHLDGSGSQTQADRSVSKETDPLGDLDGLVPDLGNLSQLPPLYEDEVNADAEYRVVCKTCGTAQYVAPSVQGMKIKCPDCFVQFKAPPPPKGWSPVKAKKKVAAYTDEVVLTPTEELRDTVESKRNRTSELLDKATRELSDEELDRLYDTDFDTAGFIDRTFGFVKDIITMSQVIGYGAVFAALFALAQFSASNTEGFLGRGVVLLTVVLVPIVALLFALPMISGGLALIETVANKQKRVSEFPAFNMFDNFGELILVAVALAAAIAPGFAIGFAFGGEGWQGTIVRIIGMMVSSFALFPLILLSMMDNNSIFQPVSGPVVRTLTSAAEAWGAYYLKTMIGFSIVLVMWFVLLGRSPLLAAIGGALLPALFFFTCQQIGALADSISDHLSFGFTPAKSDDADDQND